MFTNEPKTSFLSVNPSNQSSNSSPVGSADSSLVHTKSTNAPERYPDSYRDLLLKPHLKEFEAVKETYESLYKVRVVERLEKCRTGGFFMRNNETGDVRVSSTSCHVKGCPLCAAAKSARVAIATEKYLTNQTDGKFLTLTVKHTTAPLSEQIKKLNADFRAFRRLKEFQTAIKGGFWFLEIKLGRDDLWHIHLHCLVVGTWIARERLSALWLQVTKDSMVIDIRQIKDAKTAARYAAKYASKPAALRYLPIDQRQEVITQTKNVRTHGTWGKLQKAKLLAKPAFNPTNWQRLGAWSTVVRMMSTDEDARQIFAAWFCREPLPCGISVSYIDTFINCPEAIPRNPINQEAEPPPKLF